MKRTNSPMQIIYNDDSVFFDVDDTLIMHEAHYKGAKAIWISDPYLHKERRRVFPHVSHINLLKRNFNRGKYIIVWSAAGTEWANSVLEHLDLIPYVHLVMTKPTVFVDDLEWEQWKPKRIYIKDIGA